MTRSKVFSCKNFLFPYILLITLIVPSNVFATSAAQQEDYKVLKTVQGQQAKLLLHSNNVWSSQTLGKSVYLLDIVAGRSHSNDMGAYEKVLILLTANQKSLPLTPAHYFNQMPTRLETDVMLIFQNISETPSPIPEPSPSPCYFDPALEECQPVDGKCPLGSVFNENNQCIPVGGCPDGYGRLDDDESGKCYKNSEIKTCPDGYITHKNFDCPPDKLPASGFFGKRNFSV
jgi:hypothetical protein